MAGGLEALAPMGLGGVACRLDKVQLKTPGVVLDEGPAAHGWAEDYR